jgi:cytoskeleton protein RodZ
MSSPTGPSFGRRLRARRAGKGVTVKQAAEETRIHPSFISKMERDEFDFLAPVYVRGFLDSYARYLGMDAGPFLAEFDESHHAENNLLEVIHPAYDLSRRRISFRAVAGITFAAVVVLGIWNPGGDTESSSTSTPPQTARDAAETPVAPENEKDVSDESATDRAIGSGDRGSGSPGISFTNGIDSRIAASTGPCWVEVIADGRTIFRGMMEFGTQKRFRARANMQLLLGLPRSAELYVNGRELRIPKLETPIRIALPTEAERYL